MRAHWRPLIDRLRADESPDAVRRSLELTRRLVVENGVTYNVYADPQGADRPWALDPLPFVLPAAEWQTIEAGVAQRARLLERAARPICTARSGCSPKGTSRRSCRSAILTTSGPATACRPRGRHLAARLRRGSGARARRPLVAAGRSHAGAVGRGLRARESRDPRAGAPRSDPDMAVRRVRGFFGALRERMLADASGRRDAAGGDPHARPVQRNLFRARLSRAPARHAAGRRPRPHGARRHGVPQDARRTAPRAFDPAPARRRLLRSARAARRFRARRARV